MAEQKLTIVKIGGNIINNEPDLIRVLDDFSKITTPKVLIHGGGKKASALIRQMGQQPKMIEGRRITDAFTLDIVTMVYAGLINKKIVALLQSKGCNALGMTGADLNTIQSHKRPVKDIDYGFVGDIDKIHSDNIQILLQAKFTPVFCAITHDQSGQLLNTNADSIASYLAGGMSHLFSVDLRLCFEKKGVLENPDDENSVIPKINYDTFQKLKKSGIISEGMVPKIEGAFHALKNGVKNVYISGIESLKPGKQQKGTRLCL